MNKTDERKPSELDQVFSELCSLESILHHPELETAASDYERMTDQDFREVGASGRLYQRDFVIRILVARYLEVFNCM